MNDSCDVFASVSSQGHCECVIRVKAAINLDNAAHLQDALLDALTVTPTRLVVDLTAVPSIDDSGLDVLVGAHRRATAGGTQLVLQRPNADLTYLLEQNGLPNEDARSVTKP